MEYSLVPRVGRAYYREWTPDGLYMQYPCCSQSLVITPRSEDDDVPVRRTIRHTLLTSPAYVGAVVDYGLTTPRYTAWGPAFGPIEGKRLKDLSPGELYNFLKEHDIPRYVLRALRDRRISGRRLLEMDYGHLDLLGIADPDVEDLLNVLEHHYGKVYLDGAWRYPTITYYNTYYPYSYYKY